ncbi:MAG: PP2C family protein-serine/threonine phosphatase [Nitrospirae bacterium]|nr:PP2C family protein-serine/threonine phosphatase [Nitrospirota bacterium]
MTHHIKCSEIWGGIQGDQLEVTTCGIRASLFSRANEGGKGGDIYYLSVCGSDLLTRIALADVAGHGESVANTSQWLYDHLESHMNSGDGSQILTHLNQQVLECGYKAITTAVLASFYRSDQNLYFSYAGHHPLLMSQKGTSTWTAVLGEEKEGLSNLPLGVDEETQFVQNSIPLKAGDRLLLYTDGLTEAPNRTGEEFGESRLRTALEHSAEKDIDGIRNTIMDELLSHTSGSLNHDDVTLMVTEILD